GPRRPGGAMAGSSCGRVIVGFLVHAVPFCFVPAFQQLAPSFLFGLHPLVDQLQSIELVERYGLLFRVGHGVMY
ncbi:MAG: hypothetical protein ACK6A5_08615, partial [Flavobacteriales bacterium]